MTLADLAGFAADPVAQDDMRRRAMTLAQLAARGFTTGLLGGPVDLANMAMGGAGGEKPVMGSEWIGDKLEGMGLLSSKPKDAVGSAVEFGGGLLNPGGALKAAAIKGPALAALVFHGSPHTFKQFDPAKAGTGSGVSLGLGHNLSADKGHSKAYMGDGGYLHKVDLADEAIPQMLVWEKPVPKAIAKEVPKIDFNKPIPFGGGATVERIDGQWKLKTGDVAFPLRESEVRRMFDADTGEAVYRRLVAHLGDERAASKWLSDRGVPGISNTTEREAQNYVVFPGMEKYLKILGVE